MIEIICLCWKIFGYLAVKVVEGLKLQHYLVDSNLGEIDDIQYFQKKLYKALNVPISRMESENGFNLGRAAEITRDELKFTKFVQRIRKKFVPMFTDILKTQLLLKGVIAPEDWPQIQEHIQYDFLQDGHFAELKDAELMQDRIDALRFY